jgi:hypothetical protein
MTVNPRVEIHKYNVIEQISFKTLENIKKPLALTPKICIISKVIRTIDERRLSPMKKIICKKEYDTETATLVKKYVCGFFGDPAGYEESLYQTPAGLYFLYVCGGENSPYPTEDILRLAKTKVNEWMENH